jgi:hypothetical protein
MKAKITSVRCSNPSELMGRRLDPYFGKKPATFRPQNGSSSRGGGAVPVSVVVDVPVVCVLVPESWGSEVEVEVEVGVEVEVEVVTPVSRSMQFA